MEKVFVVILVLVAVLIGFALPNPHHQAREAAPHSQIATLDVG